jgi:hypothetical protein
MIPPRGSARQFIAGRSCKPARSGRWVCIFRDSFMPAAPRGNRKMPQGYRESVRAF